MEDFAWKKDKEKQAPAQTIETAQPHENNSIVEHTRSSISNEDFKALIKSNLSGQPLCTERSRMSQLTGNNLELSTMIINSARMSNREMHMTL